jgi:hypothetical protein
VRIRLKYNLQTGEVEELLIDDNAPMGTEDYHDEVAQAVARNLVRQPVVEDAGPREALYREGEPEDRAAAAQGRPQDLPAAEEHRA